MNKELFLLPLLLIIPLSAYATDETFTMDKIFGHVSNFTFGDNLVLVNNDTNFSHSFHAINNDGYTRSTPSIFPHTQYNIQFEQPGNYTVTDDMNPKNIGYVNVISSQTNPITNSISSSISPNITPTFSFSNSTMVSSSISPSITPLPSTDQSTSGDLSYWKSQAATWKFLAQQYYSQLQTLLAK